MNTFDITTKLKKLVEELKLFKKVGWIRPMREAWAGVGILLEQAVSNLNETAISKVRLVSFG